jgi:hypothetical protein
MSGGALLTASGCVIGKNELFEGFSPFTVLQHLLDELSLAGSSGEAEHPQFLVLVSSLPWGVPKKLLISFF